MMSSLLKDLAEIGMAIGSNDIKVFMQIVSKCCFPFFFTFFLEASCEFISITSPSKHIK